MNLLRRTDLDKRNLIEITVEADYITKVTTCSVEEFTSLNEDDWSKEELVHLLRRATSSGRDWMTFCVAVTDDPYVNEPLRDLVPSSTQDELEVSIGSVTVLYFNDKGETFEVTP